MFRLPSEILTSPPVKLTLLPPNVILGPVDVLEMELIPVKLLFKE